MMYSCDRYKYYQSLAGSLYMEISNQFLDTTLVGAGGTTLEGAGGQMQCSQLALGRYIVHRNKTETIIGPIPKLKVDPKLRNRYFFY